MHAAVYDVGHKNLQQYLSLCLILPSSDSYSEQIFDGLTSPVQRGFAPMTKRQNDAARANSAATCHQLYHLFPCFGAGRACVALAHCESDSVKVIQQRHGVLPAYTECVTELHCRE